MDAFAPQAVLWRCEAPTLKSVHYETVSLQGFTPSTATGEVTGPSFCPTENERVYVTSIYNMNVLDKTARHPQALSEGILSRI
jgi:hypothetical protein